MNAVTFENFTFTYALGNSPALSNISLSLRNGGITVICGPSGSGKSSLLRCMKEEIRPSGAFTGSVSCLPDSAIVFQNPETQLITASVIHDLVFQMENRALPPMEMKRRLSETAGYFGLEEWLHKSAETLSGGQKQLTALCAALMCHPSLLLLDEPVSQLDPLSAAAFMEYLRRINEDFSITIVMAEHRLDECADIADNIVFMENGSIRHFGKTKEVLRQMWENSREEYLPRICAASLGIDGRIALSPKTFKEMYPTFSFPINKHENKTECFCSPLPIGRARSSANSSKPIVVLRDIGFRYPDGFWIFNRLNFSCFPNEIVCLLGGNGSGKSTLLKLIAGLLRPHAGSYKKTARSTGYMPQSVRDYFIRDSVKDEVEPGCESAALAERMRVTHLLDRHPFDLSGGEQQKAALWAILSRNPELILLDEPTKGMDPPYKKIMAESLREAMSLPEKKTSVIIATHDTEFAASYADRCVMLFNGETAYEAPPKPFFAGNRYYTTPLHKSARHIDNNIITLDDIFLPSPEQSCK